MTLPQRRGIIVLDANRHNAEGGTWEGLTDGCELHAISSCDGAHWLAIDGHSDGGCAAEAGLGEGC